MSFIFLFKNKHSHERTIPSNSSVEPFGSAQQPFHSIRIFLTSYRI
ncbi:MAG: hypothetical protein ACQZ3N_03925 [cyanobacterium endosymbiont of Rhopalodia yunnanensis]